MDARMRTRLIETAQYIAQQAEGHLTFDGADIARFGEAASKGPLHPLAYTKYYQLVEAVDAEDLATAGRLWMSLLAERPIGEETLIEPLSAPSPDDCGAHYYRMLEDDSNQAIVVSTPNAGEQQQAVGMIDSAFALLQLAAPDLHDEIKALLRRIILGLGTDVPGERTFDGASSPKCWGAILLNARMLKNRVVAAEILTHESCHNLLFGFEIDEALVLNAPDERFRSPLRDDTRPMEGIYHATYVLARMRYAMKCVAESGAVSADESAAAAVAMRESERLFHDGWAVVREHARLSPTGRAIIEAAVAAMEQS